MKRKRLRAALSESDKENVLREENEAERIVRIVMSWTVNQSRMYATIKMKLQIMRIVV